MRMGGHNEDVGNILNVTKNKNRIKGNILRETLIFQFKIVRISSS
jgi:hypothetical protein